MTSHNLQVDDPRFDLAYRPESYWDAPDPLSAIRCNIKGQLRREMVTDFVTGQAPESLGPIESEFLEDTVAEGTRTFLGGIHPRWMGGEYLPDYRSGEVEIARVVLESTLLDVYSFRARRIGKRRPRILYRAEDEYESEWTLPRHSSAQPLTLGQLIELIDWSTCSSDDRDPNLDFVANIWRFTDPIDCPGFVTVESDFYPQLNVWYRTKEERWIEAHRSSRCGNQAGGA